MSDDGIGEPLCRGTLGRRLKGGGNMGESTRHGVAGGSAPRADMLCEKWQELVVARVERQVDCAQGWRPGGVILGQVTKPRCHGKELGSILTWGSPWGHQD